MQVDTTAERIRQFLVEHFPLVRHIRNDDRLLGDGVIDSLGVLEVIAFVEHEFQITVTDEDLLPGNFQSIESLAAFAQSKLNGNLPGQSER